MAIDGTYKLTLQTPVGAQEGTLSFHTSGTTLSGFIENAKGKVTFDGGTVDGDAVHFETRIPTPIGKLKARVTGKVTGDHFSGEAKLPLGSAEIEGDRVA